MPADQRIDQGCQGGSKKRLNGEALLWVRIAARQNRSVPEAMEANPASHLLLWAEFFEWERNQHEVSHYYLAQISRDIRRVLAKHPERIKLEQSLIKFKMVDPTRRTSTLETSKRAWLTLVGLNTQGEPIGGVRRRRPPPRRKQEDNPH